MTTADKIFFLSQYSNCRNRIILLIKRKEAYHTGLYSISATTISDMPKAGGKVDLSDKIIKEIDITSDIDAEIAMLHKKMAVVKSVIDRVENFRNKTILEMRFIDDMTNDEMCAMLNCSISNMINKRRKAIFQCEITPEDLQKYKDVIKI